MCFSTTASFASGVVVGTIGLATLTKIRYGREVLLGVLPLLFGLHQIEEGVIWLGLDGRVSPSVENVFVWLYILFAQALLPAIIPWSFWLAEPDRKRRRWLVPLLVLGTGLTVFALWQLYGTPIDPLIRRHSIEYEDSLTSLWWFGGLYIIVTCVPPFLSSYPWMIAFGALNAAALIVTAVFKMMFLTSVWCAVAALISVLVYLHFRRIRRLDPPPAG